MKKGELKDLRIALRCARKEFEEGRSMVEMLGTLAVMGVLSIAGIAGFKTAINKHKANEIVHSVFIANNEMQIGNKPEFLGVAGATFGTTGEYQGKPAFVTVDIEDESVCHAVKNLAEGPWVVEGDCDEESTNEGKNYCSEAATPHYAKNCCAGVTLNSCQRCYVKTGEIEDLYNGASCDGGLGFCQNGNCYRCDEIGGGPYSINHGEYVGNGCYCPYGKVLENNQCTDCSAVYPGTGAGGTNWAISGHLGGELLRGACRCPDYKVWYNNQCTPCEEAYPGVGRWSDGYRGERINFSYCYCPTGKSWNSSQGKCV